MVHRQRRGAAARDDSANGAVNEMPLAIGALVGLLALFFLSTMKKSAPVADTPEAESGEVNQPMPLVNLYAEIGTARGVDPDLLRAICMKESLERSDVIRWNPPSDVSVGIAQVLCTPPQGATPDANYVCQNRFDIDGWPVAFDDLKNPRICLDIAAQILHYNLSTFGFPRGIAAYNNWSARLSGMNGPFPNQQYVDDVLFNLAKVKGQQNG